MSRVPAKAGAVLLGAGLVLGGAVPARAQAAASAPACRPGVVAVDTTVDTLFAWLTDRLRGEDDAQFRFRAAQERTALGMVAPIPELGQRTRLADRLAEVPAGAEHVGAAEVLVWFQLRNDGRLAGLKLERRSGWPAVDVALQRAIVRADSLRSFEALPAAIAGRPIDLWLAAGFHRMPGATNAALARRVRTVDRYDGTITPPRLLSYGGARFPDAGRRAAVGDSIMFEFVVDTTGFIIPESLRLVRGTWREFVVEGLRVLRGSRFVPARIGRCPVPMRMQMPLNVLLSG